MGRKVIQVNNLSKSYRIRRESKARYMTFRDEIYHFGKSIFKKKEKSELFWALKDISFEVEQGEILGVIGRNGAGKSTLLKILSRITAPTSGEVIIEGRLGSLLEVGTGFHPELTGKENIFLGGSVLGLKQSEIKKKFDEIISFAGVEEYLDTPVKRYSTGMRVRLGFAVAAHLEPEVLLIDEVLAVGDAEFQKKCITRINEEAEKNGKTIIIVSHNLNQVSLLCRKTLLMNKGQICYLGQNETAFHKYLGLHSNLSSKYLKSIATCDNRSVFKHNESITICIECCQIKLDIVLSLSLYNNIGQRIFISETPIYDSLILIYAIIPPDLLLEGNYGLSLNIKRKEDRFIVEENSHLLSFTVVGKGERYMGYETKNLGVVQDPIKWEI